MPDPIERVDVVATVIYSGERLLMVLNEKWGAFTIPVTNLCAGQLGVRERPIRWELGSAAAMRNVAEWPGHHVGERKLGGNPARPINSANRWLADDEIRSERCHDDELISPTVRITFARLKGERLIVFDLAFV